MILMLGLTLSVGGIMVQYATPAQGKREICRPEVTSRLQIWG